MPPKSSSKKSNAASWYHCEACDVHITSKERESHEKECPIAEDAAAGVAGSLEYIRDGNLFTASVERRTFSVEELQDMPEKYVNNLIFMSEGAMRLAGFRIGQPVAIRAHAKPDVVALVRMIWPIPEKFLTTVFVTEEDLNTYWGALKGDVVKIRALPNDCVPPAKTVRLLLQSDLHSSELNAAQLRDVERILKLELKQLIYTHGSCIHINFFNKPLKFVVTTWSGFEGQENNRETSHALEQAFENLSLGKNNKEDFFKISLTTSVEVEKVDSQSDDASAEENKYLITKLDIGGLAKQLCLIEESMELALGFRNLPKGVKVSRGLLLYGSTGCGKSMICEAMCSAVGQKCGDFKTAATHIIKINSSELFSRFLGETEKNLAAYFEKAFNNYPQPTLIIIEDLHNLCPKHETNEIVKRVSSALLGMLDALSSRREAQRIFVMATTSQIEVLNPSVRRCGRLDCEVEIGAPLPKGRNEILGCLLRNVEHDLSAENFDEVAQVTHGFVGADLANLISTASLHALKMAAANSRPLNIEDIRASLLHVKPSAMREVLIECPNVRWSDIGGQAELKLKLKQAIEWPLLHPEKFKRLGMKPPRGILMFGPPGCSKTMIAKALATESQLNFLSIKGPELFSMWVGESERAVREVFRKARQVAPSIVFFDEIDAIGGERAEGGGGGSGASVKERVLTQLLTELDGVEALQNVTIVAATNRPDMIDKALLRPGRIDRIIYVGLPDAEARHEIFRIKLRKMPLAKDVNIDALVARSAGYSGAEIQAICHEAALKTLEESFEAEHVTWQEFEYALGVVQPRTSSDLLKLYDEYIKKS